MNAPNSPPNSSRSEALNLVDQYIVTDSSGIGYNDGYGAGGGIDMAMIRAVLYRQRWIILGCIAITLMAALIYTLMQTPIYRAEATVRVDPQGNYILEGQDLSPSIHINEYRQYLETLGTIVQSRQMAQSVAADLKLATTSHFLASDIDASRPTGLSDKTWQQRKTVIAANGLRAGVEVDIPFETRIMTIQYTSTSARLAARFANAYAQAFISEDTRQSLKNNQYALEYLASQIADVREKLEGAEIASNDYARRNQLVGSPSITSMDNGEQIGATTINAQTLSNINATYAKARAARIAAEQKWRTIAGAPAAQLPQVQTSVVVQTLLADRTQAQAELADLRERYREGYPAIQELSAKIATLDRQIARSGEDIKSALRNDYQIAQRQETALKAELNRVSNQSLEEQDRQIRHDLLERDATALRDQLAALLSRYNEISTAANVQAGSITLLDGAAIPTAPISPSLWRNLLIALIAGVGIAALLTVLRETLDDRLRSLADIEHSLGVGLLGHTPYVGKSDMTNHSSNPYRALTEAYASIRATLEYVVPRDHKVLQFTSSQALEGKTTSAIMLAEQMAMLGQKILLIDGDLRRPSVHSHLGIAKPLKGFVEVLTGNATLEEALLPGTSPNLDVLCISKVPPNPVELLSSSLMAEFLTKHRREYARVIFDASPVMGIADAPLLANHVDATIFVAEANRVNGGQTKAAVRRLRSVGASLVGVVLTKFKALEAGEQYGSEYRYYSYSK